MALCVRPGAPSFSRCTRKGGDSRGRRLILHLRKTNNPFPTPAPARARPPSPLALGRSGRDRPDSSLPPPTPGGGLNTIAKPLRQDPNPHPLPRSQARCPLPLPEGAFNYFKPYHFTHLLCVRPHPRPTFCLFSRYRPPHASLRFGMGRAHAREKVIRLRTKKVHKKVLLLKCVISKVLKLFINTL